LMLNFVALLALSLPDVEDRGYAHIQRQLPGLTFREARAPSYHPQDTF